MEPGVSPPTVAVIAALRAELAGLRGWLRRRARGPDASRRGATSAPEVHPVILQTGTGAHRTYRKTIRLLSERRVDWVFAIGYCGALDPELETGDIILAERIEAAPGLFSAGEGSRTFRPTEALVRAASGVVSPRFRVRRGRLLTVRHVVTHRRDKEALAEATGALAVDMESAAVALAAAEVGVGVLVARAVLDDRRLSLPAGLEHLVDEDGNPRRLAAAGRLLRSPLLLTRTVGIAKRSRRAAQSLAWAASAILELGVRAE